jgi:magnesium transporter
MLADVKKRAQKAGSPPGTLVYTGDKTVQPHLTLVSYDIDNFDEIAGDKFSDISSHINKERKTWINIEGLSDIELITEVKKYFKLHPLTVEDILNVEQRAKIEEFDDYLFITLKMLSWDKKQRQFQVEQLSIILGRNYMLTFTEMRTSLFETILGKLRSGSVQRLREQGADYLFYRVLDTVIDQYFIVLEGLGEQIDEVENMVVSAPKPENTRTLYRLKRKTIMLRRAIWPMREVINHVTQSSEQFISQFTRLYLRDVYDHTMQAIDTIETYRDMLSSMLDVYLSSLTNRMNEIMKTLTIISTIFIPITFIASIYGMNFIYMPELKWHDGYYFALSMMLAVTLGMIVYFKSRKWF